VVGGVILYVAILAVLLYWYQPRHAKPPMPTPTAPAPWVGNSARIFSYEGETKEGIQYQNCRVVVDKLGFDPELCSIFEAQGSAQTIDIPRIEILWGNQAGSTRNAPPDHSLRSEFDGLWSDQGPSGKW